MNNKTVKSLADFKRYLSNGGRVQLMSVYGKLPSEKIASIRKAEKVQTNAVKFEGGSWLHYPSAALMEFDAPFVYIYDPKEITGEYGQRDYDHKQRGSRALAYQLIDQIC